MKKIVTECRVPYADTDLMVVVYYGNYKALFERVRNVGIRGTDGENALELAIRTLEAEDNDRRLGYTPDSLSHTLEYAYAGWCCGHLAEMKSDLGQEG